MLKDIAILFFLFIQIGYAAGQEPDSLINQIVKQMDLQAKTGVSSNLFVHTDKNIYKNNETIWLSAYIVNPRGSNFLDHHTLSIALMLDADSSVLISEQYIMDSGRAFGSVLLPDNIPAGNYHFVAYTNMVGADGAPFMLFSQFITIKTTLQGNSAASISLLASPMNERHLSLLVPAKHKAPLSIKFYPEGGNISVGIPSVIGVETITSLGQSVSVSLIVYRDEKPIDTIMTTSTGLGRFKLVPQEGHRYTVKLFESNFRDSTYRLPSISKSIPIIEVSNAVVRDTLTFNVRNLETRSFMIVVHNTREIFASFPVITNARGRAVKIDLAAVPKGIAAVTLLDMMGNPLAERLFFAHFDNEEEVKLTLDSTVYGTRKRVMMKLKLNDKLNETASLSISIAQSDRIEWRNFRDIESYVYVQQNLSNFAANSSSTQLIKDKPYLEDILLVKGWRKFTWETMMKTVPADTLGTTRSLLFTGTVTNFNKTLKKPIGISVFQDSLLSLITTDVSGKFILEPYLMTMSSGKNVVLKANLKDWFNYKIHVDNPFDSLNPQLHKLISETINASSVTIKSSDENAYKAKETQIELKEVVIKTKKDYTQYKGGLVRNECGDYVCRNGYLNCRGHFSAPDNRLPVKGQVYKTSFISFSSELVQGKSKEYKGCLDRDPLYFAMKGRMVSREFYSSDFTNAELANGSDISTLYWQPMLQISSDKEAELYFYTSDIKGEYRVIVQGIGEKQLVFATTNFKVE